MERLYLYKILSGLPVYSAVDETIVVGVQESDYIVHVGLRTETQENYREASLTILLLTMLYLRRNVS